MDNDRIEHETSIDVDFPLTHDDRFSLGDVNHRELHAPCRKLHASSDAVLGRADQIRITGSEKSRGKTAPTAARVLVMVRVPAPPAPTPRFSDTHGTGVTSTATPAMPSGVAKPKRPSSATGFCQRFCGARPTGLASGGAAHDVLGVSHVTVMGTIAPAIRKIVWLRIASIMEQSSRHFSQLLRERDDIQHEASLNVVRTGGAVWRSHDWLHTAVRKHRSVMRSQSGSVGGGGPGGGGGGGGGGTGVGGGSGGVVGGVQAPSSKSMNSNAFSSGVMVRSGSHSAGNVEFDVMVAAM
jgi:hypothetical protein